MARSSSRALTFHLFRHRYSLPSLSRSFHQPPRFLAALSRASSQQSISFAIPCYCTSSAWLEPAGVYSRQASVSFAELCVRGFSTDGEADDAASRESASFKNQETTSDDAQGKDSQETSCPAGDSHEEKLDEKTQVLRAALAHVPNLGWTESALLAGARDLGLSPSVVGAFPRKEAELVEYFMDDCMEKLREEAEIHKEELSNMILTNRIVWLIRRRLEMHVPYISKWAQGLSIQANPINVPTGLKQRALLIDEIWHAAGDRSSDMDWITKRAVLGAVYTATELYMLTDYSPEFQETWSFLDRRVKDSIDCRKTAQEVSQLAMAIGAGLGNTISSFLRKQPQSGT